MQQSNFAAEKMVESLVDFFGWPRHQIHLRTGKHDADKFLTGRTAISVITYGLLWRWLTGHAGEYSSSVADHDFILSRYVGIFLDEFADLPPKSEETSRMVGKLVHESLLRKGVRLVVAGIRPQHQVCWSNSRRTSFGGCHRQEAYDGAMRCSANRG